MGQMWSAPLPAALSSCRCSGSRDAPKSRASRITSICRVPHTKAHGESKKQIHHGYQNKFLRMVGFFAEQSVKEWFAGRFLTAAARLDGDKDRIDLGQLFGVIAP
jgi:hypothetical protein